MNDSDLSSAAASRPHRLKGGKSNSLPGTNMEPESKSSLWTRIKNLLFPNNTNLREDLYLALQQTDAGKSAFTAGERIMLTNVLKLSDKIGRAHV